METHNLADSEKKLVFEAQGKTRNFCLVLSNPTKQVLTGKSYRSKPSGSQVATKGLLVN
jgi:hypothetical protein